MPDGTVPVGLGLAINGVATYGFLVVSRRALGEDAYSSLAVLWGIVFILGPGFFQPLEQEVSRVSAHRANRGEGSEPVLRKAAALGAGIFTLLTVALVVTAPWSVDTYFDGEWMMLVALILTLAAFAAGQLLRGLLAGYHRFNAYAGYFATEGLARVSSAIIIAAIGVTVVGPYGFVVAIGPIAALLVGARGQRDLVRPGPSVEWNEITQALGFLLAASVFEAFLLNVAPVTIDMLADDDQTREAGRYLNGLLMARVPLFFFQAVKASLIPNLARLAILRQFDEFVATLYRLLAVVAAISIIGVVGAGLIGPWVVELVFGDELRHVDMAILAATSGMFMVALSLGLTLIALGSQRRVAFGWLPGVITFPLALAALSDADLFLRVEVSMLAAVITSAATMAVLTRQQLQRVR